MLSLSYISHAARWAFSLSIAATIGTVHWADVRGGMLLTFSVRSFGGCFSSRICLRGRITASGKGEGEREDQYQGGHCFEKTHIDLRCSRF
jgi:hypothetical protein